MTFLSVIEVVASLIVALGGWEAIKYLLNRRANKKKENAAADKELVSLQDSRYSEILQAYKDEVENLKSQLTFAVNHQKTRSEMIEELQAKMTEMVAEHQCQMAAKQERIEALMSQINDLTSANTGLILLQCRRQECLDRVPKFGTALRINNGLLTED